MGLFMNSQILPRDHGPTSGEMKCSSKAEW